MDAACSPCGRDFLPSAQDFGDRPGLSDAATRGEGGIAIEDFTQSAKAARVNLMPERLEETQGHFSVLIDTIVREREGPEQPSPDCALMIGRITISGAAAVMAAITRFVRRETPQSMRS